MNEYQVIFPNSNKLFTFNNPGDVMDLLNKTEDPFLLKYNGESILYPKFLSHLLSGIKK